MEKWTYKGINCLASVEIESLSRLGGGQSQNAVVYVEINGKRWDHLCRKAPPTQAIGEVIKEVEETIDQWFASGRTFP